MRLPDGIRVRGNSLLVDVTVHGVRRTGTVRGADNLKAAIAKRESLKESLLKTITNGTSVPSENTWTLRQAFDKTCELHWNAEEATSWAKLRQNGEFILAHFGEATNVRDITSDMLDGLAKYMKDQGLSGATINRKMSAASRMLSVAVKKEKLGRKPVIERKKESSGRIRYLSSQEEALILSTFEEWGMTDQYEVSVLLVDTGLRPSELWRLSDRDLDFVYRLLHVWESKNEEARSVPMTTRVYDILRRRSERMRGRLFPFNNYWFDRSWNRMRAHLQYGEDKEFIPYVLRHTCASRLLQGGVGLKAVKEWLGHKSIVTTLRYAKLAPHNLMDAVKVLEVKS